MNVTWWADAWLITHLVRKEDRALHQQLIATIEKEKQQEDLKRRMAQFEIDQQEQRMRPNFTQNPNTPGRIAA